MHAYLAATGVVYSHGVLLCLNHHPCGQIRRNIHRRQHERGRVRLAGLRNQKVLGTLRIALVPIRVTPAGPDAQALAVVSPDGDGDAARNPKGPHYLALSFFSADQRRPGR